MFTSDGDLPPAYDDPQIMKWGEAAYNLPATERVGPMPEFEPSAWLELADFLDHFFFFQAEDGIRDCRSAHQSFTDRARAFCSGCTGRTFSSPFCVSNNCRACCGVIRPSA